MMVVFSAVLNSACASERAAVSCVFVCCSNPDALVTIAAPSVPEKPSKTSDSDAEFSDDDNQSTTSDGDVF